MNAKIGNMENEHSLKEFVAILAAKGYTDNFHTNAAYPDKLEESIKRYLNACKIGQDQLKDEIRLECYPKYDGEDKPYVNCRMTVNYKNEKFRLTEMDIKKKDEYGNLFGECKLVFNSTSEIPEKSRAISLVEESRPKKMRGRRL